MKYFLIIIPFFLNLYGFSVESNKSIEKPTSEATDKENPSATAVTESTQNKEEKEKKVGNKKEDPAKQGLIGATLGEIEGSDGKYYVIIKTVVPGFAAYHAGVQSRDVVLEINNKPVHSPADMIAIIKATSPGSWVKLKVQREKEALEIKVRVSSRADFLDKGPKKYLDKVAPPFHVFNRKGDSFDLANRKDKKPLVIMLWATWCPACKAALPILKAFQDRYGEKVDFAMVTGETFDLVDSLFKVKPDLKKLDLEYLRSDEGKIHIAYWSKVLPTMMILDENSKLAYVTEGFDPKTLDSAILELAALKKPKASKSN